MFLAIRRNSWHYRYYEFLRNFWGMKDSENEEEKRTSLCKYSQFIAWFSLLTMVMSPFVFCGWVVLKLARASYKVLSKFERGRKITDWMDDKFNYSDFVQTRCDNMDRSPGMTCLTMFGIVIALLCTIFFMASFLILGITGIKLFFLKIIPAIPGLLWTGLLYAGWALFWLMGSILACSWIIISNIGSSFAKVVKFLISWIAPFLPIIGVVLVWVGGILAVSFIVTYLFARFFASDASRGIKNYFSFRLNGFYEATQVNKERRAEVKIKKQIEAGEIEPPASSKVTKLIIKGFKKMGSVLVKIGNIVFNVFYWLWKILFGSTVKVSSAGKQKVFIMLGSIGLFVTVLKSLKDGVCPYIEIIDEEDIDKG